MSLYKEALDKWGIDAQLDQVVEEVGELLTAMIHVKREREDLDKFIEECADVYIMMNQMRELSPDRFEYWVNFKMARLADRLGNDKIKEEIQDKFDADVELNNTEGC